MMKKVSVYVHASTESTSGRCVHKQSHPGFCLPAILEVALLLFLRTEGRKVGCRRSSACSSSKLLLFLPAFRTAPANAMILWAWYDSRNPGAYKWHPTPGRRNRFDERLSERPISQLDCAYLPSGPSESKVLHVSLSRSTSCPLLVSIISRCDADSQQASHGSDFDPSYCIRHRAWGLLLSCKCVLLQAE